MQRTRGVPVSEATPTTLAVVQQPKTTHTARGCRPVRFLSTFAVCSMPRAFPPRAHRLGDS
jgi:hypothetical protein